MKANIVCAALALLACTVPMSWADIQPGHLVAGPIRWDGKFAIGEIYVGGTYGQTVKGGRTAHLEMQEPGKGWSTLTSVLLPDIGTNHYYLTAPLGGPRPTATTIRLRITPASAFPQGDVSTHTFPGLRDSLITPKSKHSGIDTKILKTSPAAGQFQKAPLFTDFSKYLRLQEKLPPLP